MAAVVAGDDTNGYDDHDERCTSLLSAEEAAGDCICVCPLFMLCVLAVRRLVKTFIPEEIIPDQVHRVDGLAVHLRE